MTRVNGKISQGGGDLRAHCAEDWQNAGMKSVRRTKGNRGDESCDGRPERTRTVDLYRVNLQSIYLSMTYNRLQGLLTSVSACKFVGRRVGHRVGLHKNSA